MPPSISTTVVRKKKKGISRQTILLIVFILFLAAGGIYYYLTSFAPSETVSPVELEAKRQLSIKKVNWQKALYENETLKTLHNPLTAPVEIGPIGNPTPFQPPQVEKSPETPKQ